MYNLLIDSSNETISINEVEREQMEMIYKKEEMGEFFFKKVSIIKKEKKNTRTIFIAAQKNVIKIH